MVGVRGFEPPTPSSRRKCATRLRHTPIVAGGATIPKQFAGTNAPGSGFGWRGLVDTSPAGDQLAEDTQACHDHYKNQQQAHGSEGLALHRIDTALDKFIHPRLVLGIQAILVALVLFFRHIQLLRRHRLRRAHKNGERTAARILSPQGGKVTRGGALPEQHFLLYSANISSGICIRLPAPERIMFLWARVRGSSRSK